jgi:3-deoxy-D-manno-octulosonate 8-phosphate phosphatase (KDO 8-P phosphatase)
MDSSYVFRRKAIHAKALIFGAGGVLYPADSLYTVEDGRYAKLHMEVSFNLHDGAACSEFLKVKGLDLPWFVIEGKLVEAVELRVRSQGGIYVAVGQVFSALQSYSEASGETITLSDCIYMGDDLNDLSLMMQAGATACPSDANPLLRNYVKSAGGYIAPSPGGKGAIADLVLALAVLREVNLIDHYSNRQFSEGST